MMYVSIYVDGASFIYEFASDLIKWMEEEKHLEEFLDEFKPNSLGPKILMEKKKKKKGLFCCGGYWNDPICGFMLFAYHYYPWGRVLFFFFFSIYY